MTPLNLDTLNTPPFDTEDLRTKLAAFLETTDPNNPGMKIGDYKCGVYLFLDYDGEPIYVGQSSEKLRVRIRRHLTNQRTDAVAMSVLDPFEVLDIEVWPLPQFQAHQGPEAKLALNVLERQVYNWAIARSHYSAILNEKDPPLAEGNEPLPPSIRGRIVSDQVYQLRKHPDTRIARRAYVISRLSQVIAERKVQGGLRRVLLIQAQRLQALAQRRYEGLGGAASVEAEDPAE